MASTCVKCGEPKNPSERCMNCRKTYFAQNPEKWEQYYREYQAEWIKNPENKKKAAQSSLDYYYRNKEKILKKKKTKEHREKVNAREKERKENDVSFRLRKNCSRLVSVMLKKNGGSRAGQSFLKFVSWTKEELKSHLESQFDENMSWENYGTYWHLDHIIPQSLLPYSDMSDENFKKCWDLSNLQPLEKIENLKKGNKLSWKKEKP